MPEINDVAERLRAASEAVEAAEVPEDLRVAAFEHAASLMSPLAAVSGGDASTGSAPAAAEARPDVDVRGDDPAAKAASKLHVDLQRLQRVLDFDSDGVHLLVRRSMLPRAKSEAIQQVAVLVVAGRQAAGIDPDGWTHQSHVRDATETLGVDDSKNFSTHLKRANGLRLRGSGKTGELKATAVAFEAAADLINRLASEDETR